MTSTKREIKTRDDVSLLVRSFYEKVRKDEHLGPIFNARIEDWEEHLEKLTDFWETNLLFVRNYKGNPVKVHQEVDQTTVGGIENIHFGYWLNLWLNTIDEYFIGDMAQIAKNRARNMASHIFMKIFQARKDE